MIKAIIFDLWGTLFETDATIRPFEEFALRIGREYHDPEFYTAFSEIFMTHPITDLEASMQKFIARMQLHVDAATVDALCDIIARNGTVRKYAFPETIAVLQELKKKYKIAILSNTTNISVKQLFEGFPITELADEIVFSYEVGLQKPDPRIYALTLERLGVSKDETVMVGDSLRLDVASAESFGIRGILIDRKNQHPEYPNRITTLTELERAL